ncbi:hypothetical protein C5N99_01110 [Treponema medium]|nr:hypothetical protein C5N99_01110 [Treponema medium]
MFCHESCLNGRLRLPFMQLSRQLCRRCARWQRRKCRLSVS